MNFRRKLIRKSVNSTAFDTYGDPNNPAVVLIHGLGLNKNMWRDYVPGLQENRFVLAYDLFGHGESDPPPTKPSLGLFALQLKILLDLLEVERCTVVGFSLGGMISRRFAMDYADRVESLVILNSPHERSPEQQRLVEQRAMETEKFGASANLDTTLERWFTAQFLVGQSKCVDQVRDWLLNNEPSTYAQCRTVLAAGVKELISPIPPIRLPTLIITCENDSGSTPEMTRSIATEIEGAEVVIVPQLKHMGLMEEPQVFIGHISKFLQKSA